MITLPELWVPALLSAVLVFVASSLIHQVLRFHSSDYTGVPGEANVLDALRKEGVGPGTYFFPWCRDSKEMRSDEMTAKYKQGPNGFLVVLKPGVPAMGGVLFQWFLYCLLAGFLAAYIAGRTLTAGADYLQVFRVSGAVAFFVYAGAMPIESIWFGRKWSATFKHMFDGLIYGLLTGGCFGWLWPA